MTRIAAFFCALLVAAVASGQGSDPVGKLIEKLKSKKQETRIEALTALADLGPKAVPATDTIAGFLPGLNEEERILASIALGRIGKQALPAVVKLLNHEDETTRFYVVWTLGHIGKDASEQIPRLLNVLQKDEDADVRVKTAYALARIAPGSKDVLTAFAGLLSKKDLPMSLREAIVTELRHFGAESLPLLAQVSAEFPLAVEAMESLSHVFDHNKNDAFAKVAIKYVPEVLPLVATFFVDQSKGDGLTFVISRQGETLLPRLEQDLKDSKKRTEAIVTLGRMGTQLVTHVENPELVKKIAKLLQPQFRSPDQEIRNLLASTAPLCDDTEAAFEELLLDDADFVRQQALNAFQTRGIDVLSKLQARYKKAKGDDRLRIACVLGPMSNDPATMQMLWDNANHKDSAIRFRIACSLLSPVNLQGDADRVLKQAMPEILTALRGKDAGRREHAALAIEQCGPFARAYVPQLIGLIKDAPPTVRVRLLNTMQQHAVENAEAILKVLPPLIEDADMQTRLSAVQLVMNSGKGGIPLLARSIEKEKELNIWSMACFHAEHLGRDAEVVAPALLKHVDDPERGSQALRALVKVSPAKMFPVAIATIKKRDATFRKVLIYERETQESPTRLGDALLKDWAKADAVRSGEIAHAIFQMLELLPDKEHDALMYAVSTRLTERLALVEQGLKAKEGRVRLAAVENLGKLDLLWRVLGPHGNEPNEKQVQEFFQRHDVQRVTIERLYTKGRSDRELEVRRAARKAQATELPERGGTYPVWLTPMPGPQIFPRGFGGRFP